MSINKLYSVFTIVILVFMSCNDNGFYAPVTAITHRSGEKFAASASCMECHENIVNDHLKTAHFQSSSLASSNTIGDFTGGYNSLLINDSLNIKIEQNDSLFYHKVTNTNTGAIIDQKPVDIVIGSGKKGKAYVYWQNDSLYQLHASYFTATHSLIKSPGYSSRIGLQNKRPITERCLECHTTFAQTKSKANTYKRSQVLLGIDCQRCHGPSQQHVSFHKNNPNELHAKHIVGIPSLNRQQQMDLCALCHSGARKRAIQPRFSYKVGDQLNTSSTQDYFSTAKELDVHGNQVGMLRASKCFQKSELMTCTTCHDPHKNQRNDTSFFRAKCIGCHQKESDTTCTLSEAQKGEQDCVSCHMPKTISKTMFAKNSIANDTVNVEVISHLIGIYNTN